MNSNSMATERGMNSMDSIHFSQRTSSTPPVETAGASARKGKEANEIPAGNSVSETQGKFSSLDRSEVVSEQQIVKAIEKAVKAVQGPHTYLEFSVHDATNRLSIRVHDQETGEVIREIPPEKTLDFVAKLWEMAGILVDKRH